MSSWQGSREKNTWICTPITDLVLTRSFLSSRQTGKHVRNSLSIVLANIEHSFEIRGGEGGIFLKCSRFNHACHPWANCTYRVIERKYLKVSALCDIAKGQELTISYTNNPDKLPAYYGFYCDCAGCPLPPVACKSNMLNKGNQTENDDFFY